jgi:IS1 family transposase
MPDRSSIMVTMNKLSTEKRAQIIGCLVEGMSIRATVRLTGAAKNTVTKLLADLGAACSEYQDGTFQGLNCQRIECDEIWSFVGAKAKHVPEGREDEWGDWWTWVALDADSKLVPSWYVGKRTALDALEFMRDVASRLDNRVQLSTDGHGAYLVAVDRAFDGEIDYAMIQKMYGTDPKDDQRRYSPAVCTGVERRVVLGDPDPDLISTSYVERSNLTMRMSMRRFTRLTNAFSKKVENLAAAVSLHFMHYNFARPHKTLSKPYPTTPAMAAGVADHVWTLREIAGLLE